jgi:hypothetical protein
MDQMIQVQSGPFMDLRAHSAPRGDLAHYINKSQPANGPVRTDEAVRKIRILLVGGSRRLREIIMDAVANEPDMAIAGYMEKPADLAAVTVRRRVDLVLFSRREGTIPEDQVDRLLHANPRLALLAVDAVNGRARLHHLVRVDEEFPPLEQASLAAAIRTGTALRLH